jgi:hypothetical protein
VPDRLLGILRNEALEFSFGLFVVEVSRLGAGKDAGKFRPGIGGRHVDDTDRFDARLWRIDPEEGRGLATLDATPEFPLRDHDQVLIERIRMDFDLDPRPR